MKRLGLLAGAGYIGTIFAANWAVERYGVVSVGFGLMAPAAVYLVGLAFTLRDLVQDHLGRLAVVAAVLVRRLARFGRLAGLELPGAPVAAPPGLLARTARTRVVRQLPPLRHALARARASGLQRPPTVRVGGMSAERVLELVMQSHLPVTLPDGTVLCLCHSDDNHAVFEGPVFHRRHVAALQWAALEDASRALLDEETA